VLSLFRRAGITLTYIHELVRIENLTRHRAATPSTEPANFIARALHERLPERLQGDGLLFLWLREGRNAKRVVRALRTGGFRHELVESCARVELRARQIQECISALSAVLSEREQEDTKALFVNGLVEPRLAEFSRMTTLHALDVMARSGWLLDQLAEGRFTSFFHPIVHASDTRRVFAHEALLRGVERDGSMVAPQPILDLARQAGMLLEVDFAACRSAIREATRHGPDMTVFINFSPAAIQDPQANLSAMLSAVDEAGLPRERVIFEVVEADRFGSLPHLDKVLRGYRRAGFRVALDDLGAGWSTLNLVHRVRPDFIKLDRELIRGVHLDPVKDLIAGKLLEIGRGLGIRTIVEGIEQEAELCWARDHGADFVQGFLVGRPSRSPLPAMRS
jgi:EAL domain-containing protein (putative c-di-GMP-specific phosphodiesterase class I)